MILLASILRWCTYSPGRELTPLTRPLPTARPADPTLEYGDRSADTSPFTVRLETARWIDPPPSSFPPCRSLSRFCTHSPTHSIPLALTQALAVVDDADLEVKDRFLLLATEKGSVYTYLLDNGKPYRVSHSVRDVEIKLYSVRDVGWIAAGAIRQVESVSCLRGTVPGCFYHSPRLPPPPPRPRPDINTECACTGVWVGAVRARLCFCIGSKSNAISSTCLTKMMGPGGLPGENLFVPQLLTALHLPAAGRQCQ